MQAPALARNAVDVRDRETAPDGDGATLTPHRGKRTSFGAGSMRSVFALGLLISLCVPAGAATVHQPRARQHAIVRPSQGEMVPPGWYKFPGYPPIPPEQNRNLDPSNFGGA